MKHPQVEWQFRKSAILPHEWAKELSISPQFLHILSCRNFTTISEIDSYLSVKKKNLIPPQYWPGIPYAAQILADELLKNKKLAVWGDYDVDGITATAITLDILEEHGINAGYYLPDRKNDGYGINIAGIEQLVQKGYEILLAVDCGITDCKAIERANELGMKVIVCDHHIPGEILPNASAICDPKVTRHNEAWPCPDLSGAGVTFYFMAYVNHLLANKTGKKFKLDKVLDLVALGTMADIVPLEGQNRILAKTGLSQMGKSPRPGVALLKKICNIDASAEISDHEIAFKLAPRLNAAGRMHHANLALELLRSKNYNEAEEYAYKLDQYNLIRKKEENLAYLEAKKQADEFIEKSETSALILYGKNWHPGILGIVASKMVDEFHLPTIVISGEKENLKGSGRSISNFDLHSALQKISHLLNGFGGHKLAAGISLTEKNLEKIRKDLNDIASEYFKQNPQKKTLLLDSELDFNNALNYEFIKELELMQPFGNKNEEPVFSSPPVKIISRKMVGPSLRHASIYLQDLKTGKKLHAIAWRMALDFTENLIGKVVKIAYTPRIDNYNGNLNIIVEIKDYKLLKE